MKDVRVGPVVTSTPLMRRVAAEIAKAPAKPKKTAVPIIPAVVPPTHDDAGYKIDWSQCPHCAERRRKHAERIARYRKKLT